MKKTSVSFLLFIFLISGIVKHANATSGIYFVDASKTSGLNNGSSWTNAFTSLDSALLKFVTGSSIKIWVAAGTYKPTIEVGGVGARYAAFQMKEGIKIYGGFAGTETLLTQRDIHANPTILSGDIGAIADMSDNCYHVFYHPDGLGLTNNAVIDGFTIRNGNANGTGQHRFGGGFFNDNNMPTITNCIFSNNSSAESGGAIYNLNSNTIITKCMLSGNYANTDGGGIFNDNSNPIITNCGLSLNKAYYSGGALYNKNNSSPVITNCVVAGNKATYGGGMYSELSNPSVINCTFSGDTAYQGGALYNTSNISIVNSIFWGNIASFTGNQIYADSLTTTINYSCYSNVATDIFIRHGVVTASNSIYAYPGYVDAYNGDFRIVSGSPCRDAGNNASNTELFDIRDSNRIQHAIIDIGAYEWANGEAIENIPVSGTLTKTPNTLAVCQGNTISAALTAGAQGNGVDDSKSRTHNAIGWSSWTSYTPGTGISTTGIDSVEIRTKRKALYFYDGAYNTVHWIVNPIPTAPVITLNDTVLHADVATGVQWYDQNGLISAAVNQDHTVTTANDYHAVLTVLGCSSVSSNVINVVFTGINSTGNDNTIKVYPNPVSNNLNLQTEGNTGIVNFEIMNASGQTVYKGSVLEKATIFFENFSAGIYLIKFDTGRTVEFKKVVKE